MELASDFLRVGDFIVTPANLDTARKILITYSESPLFSLELIRKKINGKLKFINFHEVEIDGRRQIGMVFQNSISKEELMELLS